MNKPDSGRQPLAGLRGAQIHLRHLGCSQKVAVTLVSHAMTAIVPGGPRVHWVGSVPEAKGGGVIAYRISPSRRLCSATPPGCRKKCLQCTYA